MTATHTVNLNVFFKKVGSGIALARVLPRTGICPALGYRSRISDPDLSMVGCICDIIRRRLRSRESARFIVALLLEIVCDSSIAGNEKDSFSTIKMN